MTRKEKEEILTEAGWHTWYHPDYWVNSKCVKNAKEQDYTNYGESFEDAWKIHCKGGPQPQGMVIPPAIWTLGHKS